MLAFQGRTAQIFDDFYRPIEEATIAIQQAPEEVGSEEAVRLLLEARGLLDQMKGQGPTDIWSSLERLYMLVDCVTEQSQFVPLMKLKYKGPPIKSGLLDVKSGIAVLNELLEDQRRRSWGERAPIKSAAQADHDAEVENETRRLSTTIEAFSDFFNKRADELQNFPSILEFNITLDKLVRLGAQLRFAGETTRGMVASRVLSNASYLQAHFRDILYDDNGSLDAWVAGLMQQSNYIANVLLRGGKSKERSTLEVSMEELAEPPKPQHGVQFAMKEGKIAFAPPPMSAETGSGRVGTLLPVLQEVLASALLLFGGNCPHPAIHDALNKYSDALQGDSNSLNFDRIAAYGVILANAERAALRSIGDRLEPELEDGELAALRSVLDLHGPFILSTQVGQDFLDDLARYQRSAVDDAVLRENLVEITAAAGEEGIVEESVKTYVEDIAANAGQGDDPSRSSLLAMQTGRSLSTVLLATAIVAIAPVFGAAWVGKWTLSLIVADGIKRSEIGKSASDVVRDALDDPTQQKNFMKLAPFVLRNEQAIRRLIGQRRELSWLTQWLDWIKENAR